MKHKELPEVVDEVLSAMKDIPGPNPARQAADRRTFLTQARLLRQQQAVSRRDAARHRGWRKRLLSKEAILMTPLAKAMIIALLISGLTTGTALAADASLPNQMLYPLDLAIEQVQQGLAFTSNAQARLSLQIATERSDEVIALVGAGEPPDQANLERLQTQLEHCLRAASQLEEPQMLRVLTQLRDMAQNRSSLMQMLGLPDGAAIMTRFRDQAQNAIDDPQGFQLHYREGWGWQDEPASGSPGGASGSRWDQEEDEEPPCDPALEDCEPAQTPERSWERERDYECDPAVEECEPAQDPAQERDRGETCDPEVEECEPAQDQTQDQDRDQTQDTEPIQDQDQDQDQDQAMDGTGDGDGSGTPPSDGDGSSGGGGGGGGSSGH